MNRSYRSLHRPVAANRMPLWKRMMDLVIAVPLLVVSMPIQVGVAAAVKATSKGPALFTSTRVGRNGEPFTMVKFRSMQIDAPMVATHLLGDSDQHITPIGRFLRDSSLDELPQLIHVVTGDMTLVGPRPALPSQYDLLEARSEYGIDQMTPGITGLAQINGRDEISIAEKVQFEMEYLRRLSFRLDVEILLQTVGRVAGRADIGEGRGDESRSLGIG